MVKDSYVINGRLRTQSRMLCLPQAKDKSRRLGDPITMWADLCIVRRKASRLLEMRKVWGCVPRLPR